VRRSEEVTAVVDWTILSPTYLTAVVEWAGAAVTGLIVGPGQPTDETQTGEQR
jgi:hypothetical protein